MRSHFFLAPLTVGALLCTGCERQEAPPFSPEADAPAFPEAFREALPDESKLTALASVPGAGPAYQLEELNACPLRYGFIADIIIRSPAGYSPSGRELELRTSHQGSFEARVNQGRWELHAGNIERVEYVDDAPIRHPGIAADALAPVLLSPREQQLQEEEGPSTLWSAMGEFPGLTIFFPALPTLASPGSTAPWTPRIHQRGSSLAVETTRGKAQAPPGYTPPKPQGTTHQAEVELKHWAALEGTPVALLESDWSTGPYKEYMRSRAGALPEPVELTLENRDEYSGRYVASESGRLLFASVQSMREQQITGSGNYPEQRFTIALKAQMNLLQSCESPVLNPVSEGSDLGIDNATRAVNRFVTAVKRNDLDQVHELLSPALREKPGSQKILETLRTHLDTHGPAALGLAERPLELMEMDQGHRVELAGKSTSLGDDEENVLVTVYYTEVIDGQARITGLGADTSSRDMLWEELEITEKRFFAREPR
ncbi:hypothetical protein DL240_11125 [Lujinxingia litoralis]|uniref:Uncharacterized protein n=1 Tax=Lujinxingia litoralis TaxID=2211119 RepID=A0A328C7J8_9DELT|nr:hypothetical protein [Lujinxingia litoralis]RAL22394.1 hypothetical protein DL240_11125 [Lujinxingia litoralis]